MKRRETGGNGGVPAFPQERSRTLGRGSARRPWTAGELRIVARFSRAIVRGKYPSVKAAAPDLHRELLFYHQNNDPERGRYAPRTPSGAFARLLEYSRRHGRAVVRHVRWSSPEKRVLDAYARALLRGRYRNATEATRDCMRDLQALRRRYPKARWLAAGRTQGSILGRLLDRANRLGRRLKSIRWTRQELRMIDAYARRVAGGEFNAMEAARTLLRERERLHERYPQLAWLIVRRSIRTAHCKIWRRAQEFGRPFLELKWAGPELAVLERFARGVVTGQYPSAADAARVALTEIEALHARRPDARWARMRRTFFGTKGKVVQLAHTLAEVWQHARRTPGEKAVLERYAQAFIQGHFRSVSQAAQACHKELARRHARNQRRRGRLKTPAPRSFRSDLTYLKLRTGELGRPRGQENWSSDELRIAREWSERYLKERPALTRQAAARGMGRELVMRGFRRTLAACAGRIAGTPRTDASGRRLSNAPSWSRAELRIVNRHVRALLYGRYPSAYRAAADCLPKILRLQPEQTHTDTALPSRSLGAVARQIADLARSHGRIRPGAWWSRAELDVIRPYARALAEGRYSGVTSAGRAAALEIARMRKLNPSAGTQVGRTAAAIVARVQDLASEFGWRAKDRRWPRAQKQVVLNYARAYEQGEYDGPDAAACACRAELERLSREQPDADWLRRLPAVRRIAVMIVKKVKRRTHPPVAPYLPQERALINRLARHVISGKYRDGAAAARVFMQSKNRQGADRGVPTPTRKLRAVMAQISGRARALGRTAKARSWSRPELVILERYSQDLIQGRYTSAKAAAAELQRTLKQLGQKRPDEFPSRTPAAVCARLVEHSRNGGREARRHARWTEPELRLVDKLAYAVRNGKFPDKARAADAYLKEMGAMTGDHGRDFSPHTRDAIIARLLTRIQALRASTAQPVITGSNSGVRQRSAPGRVEGRR